MTYPGITLKKSFRWKKRFLAVLFVVIINSFFCIILYSGSILWRSIRIGGQHSRMIGSAYQVDGDYGYFPKPNSLAYASLPFGEQVPVLFNDHGFRVPLEEPQVDGNNAITILFLGDSFTLGWGVPAEKTFPWLTAQQLNAKGLNAGTDGWGLSQMLLRARQEIPRFKPDYCIVQYTPWLVERSQRFYGPTIWGKLPTPYFYQSNDKIFIQPPVFLSKNFSLPIQQYAGKNLLPFIWNVGIPLYLHDDYHTAVTWIKWGLGFLPSPVNSSQTIVDFTYGEIKQLCGEHGGKMLVLKLYGNGIADSPQAMDSLDDATYFIIDTLEPLASRLAERSVQAWGEQYAIWRGNPPRAVDGHPNALAHRIVAGTIIDAIQMIDAEVQ